MQWIIASHYSLLETSTFVGLGVIHSFTLREWNIIDYHRIKSVALTHSLTWTKNTDATLAGFCDQFFLKKSKPKINTTYRTDAISVSYARCRIFSSTSTRISQKTHCFNVLSKLKAFLRSQRVYNFLLCIVIRNYVLGSSVTSQMKQVELYFLTNATWFQKIYFGQRKKYILIRKKTFTKYMKWETSDNLKRRHCDLTEASHLHPHTQYSTEQVPMHESLKTASRNQALNFSKAKTSSFYSESPHIMQ